MGLNEKLLKIQERGVKVEKTGINPHFKSTYVTLDALLEVVMPLATENGLVITNVVDEQCRLVTTVTDSESGEAISSFFPIYTQEPQKIGATISYAKRYSIGSIFNMTTEADDDGNTASGVGEVAKKDDKPWMNEPQLKALADNIGKYGSADEAIKAARQKYAVSKVMSEKIKKLFDTDEEFPPF